MRVESTSQLVDFVRLWKSTSSSSSSSSPHVVAPDNNTCDEALEFVNLDLGPLVWLAKPAPAPAATCSGRPLVRYLRCYRCRMRPGGMRRLASCLQLPHSVRTLNVSGNSLGGEPGARELGEVLQTCQHLEELYIHRNGLTSEACHLVVGQGLPLLPRLATLNLQNNCLGLEGARVVARALSTHHDASSSLQMLILASNHLGDQGVRPIADMLLHARCRLQWLDLSDNAIGNGSGLRALADALSSSSCTLHTLMLSGNALDDEGAGIVLAGMLTRNRSLRTLDLACNQITSLGVRQLGLAASYSNCLVADLGLFRNPADVDAGLLRRAVLVRQMITLRWPAERPAGKMAASPLSRLPRELVRLVGAMLEDKPQQQQQQQ